MDLKETRRTREKYNRNYRFYDPMEFPMEWLRFRRWRRNLFRNVRGPRILEIGTGTGKNLKYYPRNVSIFGVDLSEKMMARAKALPESRGVCFVQMDAEHLAFRDHAFDTVLATFVFCSVSDPVAGLKEIKRVLKPGNDALFIEHVLPEKRWLAWLFKRFNAVVEARTGVHIDRNTAANIRNAGLFLRRQQDLWATAFRFFVAENKNTAHVRNAERF